MFDFAMGATRLCFLFCLFLAVVSSQTKLNNIDDLRNVGYGRPHPRHGLQLLFWFAQNVNVDQNTKFELNFFPSEGNYGFHYFANRERILPQLTFSERYYEVGNLNRANQLPMYVQRHRNTYQPGINVDRLIISVDQHRRNSISRVFITSHNSYDNGFNPDQTYEIDPALILQIRQTYQYNDNIRSSSTEDERCHQFLHQTEYYSNYCRRYGRRKKRSTYPQCNAYEGIKLQIKTSTQGYSKLIWENIPAEVMENYEHVYIDICQNSDSNKDHFMKEFKIQTSSGTLDTSVSLNAGLQPRLRLYTTRFIHDLINPYIWYGPEFDGANGVNTFTIEGFEVGLQLYAKDGKACARLYIEKTFSNWKDVFDHSWVGFYKSSQDKNDGYSTYQYAVYFAMSDSTSIKNYDIYQYDSSLAMAPGVQIRFLLDKQYNNVLAKTTPWEE